MSDNERTSEAWQAAHEARAEANDLARQAAEAAAHAADLEARATADAEGVEYEPADASAGTWEAAVSGGDAPSTGGGEEDEQQ